MNKKTTAVKEQILPEEYDFNPFDDKNEAQHRRDVRLASKDPSAYCADRCVTTGNCDVFEDMFSLSPQEVMEFCTECVLSDDEEVCTTFVEYNIYLFAVTNMLTSLSLCMFFFFWIYISHVMKNMLRDPFSNHR